MGKSITPKRCVPLPTGTSTIDFLAACSSSLILSRTRVMTFGGDPAGALPGSTLSRTVEPLGPRIRSTTSASGQLTTSTISSFAPLPTPTMRSSTLICSLIAAGPPAMMRRTTVYSFSVCSAAPIPSRDRRILIRNSSELRGEKYEVCGSTDSVYALMKN